MTAQESREEILESDLIETTTVVDADVQISYKSDELQQAIARRLPEPYGRYLTVGKEDDTEEEEEEGFSFNYAYPIDGRPRTMGGTKELEVRSVTSADDVREGLCEVYGIDHPILNTSGVLNRIQDVVRVKEEMRAANDLLLDRFLDGNEGVYGLATVYAKRPEYAAEELDRIGDEDGIVGAYVQSSGVETALGNPMYDVMYRAAEDNGLPIVFHGTADIAHARDIPSIVFGFRSHLEAKAVGHPWSQMVTLTSLALEGVPVKFPDLEFVFLNAGVSWARWMMARINREYGQRPSEAPLLDDLPEKYIERSCYFGLHPLADFGDPDDAVQMLRNVGAENILYASNFPRTDFDQPAEAAGLLERAFSREGCERVLHGNAVDVFGLN